METELPNMDRWIEIVLFQLFRSKWCSIDIGAKYNTQPTAIVKCRKTYTQYTVQ